MLMPKAAAKIGKNGHRPSAGLHVLGRISVRPGSVLKRMSSAKRFVSQVIRSNGLHELGSYYHEFSGGGFTGVICLVESHIAMHTWPEFGWLTLEVYLCDYSRDNSDKCRQVFGQIADYFRPVVIKKNEIKR